MDAMRLAKKAGINFKFMDTPSAIGTASADLRRETLGHYSGAMLYYGGEWYWGIDRLHYLEARLETLGLLRIGGAGKPIYMPPQTPNGSGHTEQNCTGTYPFAPLIPRSSETV